MNVFIGCSSRDDIDNIYKENAIQLANYLSRNHYDLICGGTHGVMKILQDIFTQNNRTTQLMGVNNYFKIDEKLPNAYNYDTIKERKHQLIQKANLILFLPGGFGTLDEIFTSIESKRAQEHNHPIVIININHYYDNLLKQLEIMYQEQFASNHDQSYYHITTNIEETIKYIEKLGVKNEQ